MISKLNSPPGAKCVIRYTLNELNLSNRDDEETLNKFLATIPKEEAGEVVSLETRIKRHGSDGSYCLMITTESGKPAACLIVWLLTKELNWLEFGTIYVDPCYRKRGLSRFLVALSFIRSVLLGSELSGRTEFQHEWQRCFAIVHPADSEDGPETRGTMCRILNGLSFKPLTPPQDLLQARARLSPNNSANKDWLFPSECAPKTSFDILDKGRDPESPELLVFKKHGVVIDCSNWRFFRELPAGSFSDMLPN